MKVYRVVVECDGETTKVPGKVSTEVIREEYRYAADIIEQVWDAIEWIRVDQERTVIAIIEEAPAIIILKTED